MVDKKRLGIIAGAATIVVGIVGLFIRLKRNRVRVESARDL